METYLNNQEIEICSINDYHIIAVSNITLKITFGILWLPCHSMLFVQCVPFD